MKRSTHPPRDALAPILAFAAIGSTCVVAALMVTTAGASAAKPGSAGPNPNASAKAHGNHGSLSGSLGASPALSNPVAPGLQTAPGLTGQLPRGLSSEALQAVVGPGSAHGAQPPRGKLVGSGNLLASVDGDSVTVQHPSDRIAVRIPKFGIQDQPQGGQPNGMARRFLGAGDLHSFALHGEGSTSGSGGDGKAKGGGKATDKGRDGGQGKGGGKSWDKGRGIGKGADHPIFTPEDYPLGKWHHFPGKGKSDGDHVDGWHWGWGGSPSPPDGDPPKDDPPKDDPPKDDPPKDDPPKDDPPKDDPPKDDPPNGDDDAAGLATAHSEVAEMQDTVLRDPFAVRTLERMGIYVRGLTQEELRRAALGNRELYNSLPDELDAPPSARPISINRLRRDSVLLAVDLYSDMFLELNLDPETGELIEIELIDQVALVIGVAWADFVEQSGGEHPQNFRLFLSRSDEHEQTLEYMDGLNKLLRELWVMGLTRAEYRHSLGRVLEPILPDGLDLNGLEQALGADRIG